MKTLYFPYLLCFISNELDILHAYLSYFGILLSQQSSIYSSELSTHSGGFHSFPRNK